MVLSDKNSGIGERLLTAGTAACVADFLTFPLDTAKVRLQIQGEGRGVVTSLLVNNGGTIAVNTTTSGTLQYRGVVGTVRTIARQEGFRALYNGLSAGLQRQMCFASVRLGLYDSVKDSYATVLYEKNDVSMQFGARILAGFTTGCGCVLLAQPTDVVKVRYQAHSRLPGAEARYKSTFQAYRQIFIEERIGGLWRGTVPNIFRNSIINVSEIVCYDVVKDLLMKYVHMRDSIPLHFTSACVAGFCATVCASPADVIKTRYMNAPKGKYNGPVDCTIQLITKEGAVALYKGFVPSFIRLVSWNICLWITFEQIKAVVHKQRRPVDF